MNGLTLGLDLGSNSIGWALIDEPNQRIVAAGVRVFPEGVDAFDTAKEKSRTQERRTKRAMRRQIARRARRKFFLRLALWNARLLPDPAIQFGPDNRRAQRLVRRGSLPSIALAAPDNTWLQTDPYQLRRKGLDHPLTPHEFGRVLLHLNMRRGFLSNSKSDKAKQKETSDMLKEISALAKEIDDAGHRTLGEHLAASVAKPGEKPLVRVRGRHTRRDMLRKEFDLLWSAQKLHHPQLLTDELKKKLDDPDGDETWWMRGAIFGQRNLYWPASMIGRCELEPRERRCLKAERIAQRYRLLSEVNNLKYIDPDTGRVCSLDETQRTLLLDHLSKRKDMPFEAVRKLLGMLETVKFNLEKGDRAKLKGHVVDYLMAKESPFASAWHDLPERRKDEIVQLLADPRTPDDSIVETACRSWGLSPEQAQSLLNIQLPAGYLSLSRKALEKLVPHMERGLLLMTDDDTPCALTLAGYLRPDQRPRKKLDSLPPPPDLPNPVVRQALHELRRVVNAIIGEYGKPARIHIELARSIKMGREDREKYNKARAEREEARDAAAEAIRAEAPGTKLSRDLIDKYLLWKQQGERCVYSGRTISFRQLLPGTGEVDVDHIFPRWRSLDDSFANKVVCFRDMNHQKGDQTPFEWLAGDPARLEALKHNVRALPWRKRARFTQEKLDTDEFSARQLVDTAYITRAAADYLRCLVVEPHHVLGGKGTYTAELRHLWGLETILSELPDSPAWAAQSNLRPGEKNRADHRHHTIDAIVVALTDQRRLQSLSRLHKTGESGAEIAPWDSFRDSVKAVAQKINVSHRVQRRVSGALHDENPFGRTNKEGVWAIRKPVEGLSLNEIEHIRDPIIRRIVSEAVGRVGLKGGRRKKGVEKDAETGKKIKGALADLKMPSGVPIKRVRILKEEKTIQAIRGATAYVKPASTHHLCLFQWTESGETVRGAVFVTMLEAIARVKAGQPIIQRVHPKHPNATFLMSLSSREVVLLTIDGRQHLYRYDTAASTTQQMTFYPVTAAEHVGKLTKYPSSFMELQPKKVTVDPLGRIRWAND